VLATVVGRLYVGIPFVPPSGREIVARLSGLPIPIFAQSEDAVEECSGGFCRDYYGRGLVRLDHEACSKAIASAKAHGWQSLPLPSDVDVLQESSAPPTPREGYFHFEQKESAKHQFSWIDTVTCRAYAELDIT
jgi:hypothetical protein